MSESFELRNVRIERILRETGQQIVELPKGWGFALFLFWAKWLDVLRQ